MMQKVGLLRTKEKEQQISGRGGCLSLHQRRSWLWRLAKQGWGPLAGQIGGLADVLNGKGGSQTDVQLY